MDGIIFHKPYQGKVGNDYTYKIQELFRYYYLLQEITKELHEIIKQKPEHESIKNNNQKINLEINKLTKNVSYNESESNKILQNVKNKKKSKFLDTHLFNLVCARKILLKRIPFLRRYIKTLPVPQNNFENDNQGPNNNQNYSNPEVSKPKQTEKFTTTSSKIDGKRLGKSNSKAFRGQALVRNEKNMEKMRETQELEDWEAARAENEARYEEYLKEMQKIWNKQEPKESEREFRRRMNEEWAEQNNLNRSILRQQLRDLGYINFLNH